ncbi:MAG: DUF6069 family protein [Thermoleophilia bacterium]
MWSRHRRIATIVLAPAAALALWGLLRSAGVGFELRDGRGAVGAAEVAGASLVAALAGCGVAALIDRRIARARVWWVWIATTALSLSTAGPAWMADGGTAVALIGLHLVVGAVVIGGLAPTLPLPCGPGRRAARSTAARRAA